MQKISSNLAARNRLPVYDPHHSLRWTYPNSDALRLSEGDTLVRATGQPGRKKLNAYGNFLEEKGVQVAS